MVTGDDNYDDILKIPLDSGLRCPTCGYNLTGIADAESEAGGETVAGGDDKPAEAAEAVAATTNSPRIEHRCPECGNAFDLEQLRAILAGAPQPIPIWDDKDRNVVFRFVHVCLLTWFMPWQLGQTFPRRCEKKSARQFRSGAFVAACACLLVNAIAHSASVSELLLPAVLAWCVIMVFGLLAGVSSCEAMIADVLLSEPG